MTTGERWKLSAESEALVSVPRLGVRVSADDLARIDALADRFPIGTRLAIARFALRIGLDAIEADPTVLLGGTVRGRKAPKRR